MTLEHLITPVRSIKKSWLFVLALVAISGLFTLKFSEVKAQDISINSAQNCDANAVMWCGASSVSQLINRYNDGDGYNSAASIQHIYSFFGISSSQINSMRSSSVDVEAGWVGKNNHVYNNHNDLIATGAITGGRSRISGSMREKVDGTVFFVRPPSVSFQDNFLSAYVVLVNNRFAFAILSSCGNAVMATPVAQSQPKPMPTPSSTTPTPTTTTPATTPVQTPPAQPSTSISANSNCSNSAIVNGSSNNSTIPQGGNCNTTVQQIQQTTNKTINNTETPAQPSSTTPQTTPTTTTPTPVASSSTPMQPSTTPVVMTTSAPTTLVDTGPGNLIAIFATVSAIAAITHHLFISRVKAKQQI
jgi:hypothetical protein